jgi:hypothetical protein
MTAAAAASPSLVSHLTVDVVRNRQQNPAAMAPPSFELKTDEKRPEAMIGSV